MKVLGFQNYILCIEELIRPEVCQEIIKIFQNDPARHPGYSIKATGEKKVTTDKVSTELEIVHDDAKWKNIHKEIHEKVAQAIGIYASESPGLQVKPLRWSGYKIKMYEKGAGHFKWHFDALGPGMWCRQLALIIYLNDVEKGGETQFHHQQMQIKPKAGYGILFPPFWTHLHCGTAPESNDKYIITSFVEFEITG